MDPHIQHLCFPSCDVNFIHFGADMRENGNRVGEKYLEESKNFYNIKESESAEIPE